MTPSFPTRRSSDLRARKHGEERVRIIHGNKGQNTRINAINDFREGTVDFLVATDVVSRGIDITGVSHVVNFDIPLIYEDYVHRIGRTGRMEKEGDAISFCTPAEEHHLQKIEQLRSEEHTSELQFTNAHLVCRLLLEKKKIYQYKA